MTCKKGNWHLNLSDVSSVSEKKKADVSVESGLERRKRKKEGGIC